MLATPTEALRTVSSDEGTPTNQNQTLPASPAPSVTPTAVPTTSDIITSATGSEITACSTFRPEDSPGQTKTQIQTDAGKSGDLAGPGGA